MATPVVGIRKSVLAITNKGSPEAALENNRTMTV
jgi:hypothetical protein